MGEGAGDMTDSGATTDGGQAQRRWADLKAIPSGLFGFILRHTGKAQWRLLLLTVASYPIYYYSLEWNWSSITGGFALPGWVTI